MTFGVLLGLCELVLGTPKRGFGFIFIRNGSKYALQPVTEDY
jgi:hypothetical protein